MLSNIFAQSDFASRKFRHIFYNSKRHIRLFYYFGLKFGFNSLNINDIIIVGHEKAQGVFFVSNIVRSGAASEKSVQLNYKMISPR
jgi:hypothetical protein